MVKIYNDKQIFTTFSWKEYLTTKAKDYFIEFRETLADVLHIRMLEKGQPYIPTKVIPKTKTSESPPASKQAPTPVVKTYVPEPVKIETTTVPRIEESKKTSKIGFK